VYHGYGGKAHVRYKIDELAALVYPREPHEKIFAMIDGYLDESGIHEGARICIVAGYFGGKGQMKKLETAWKKVLSDYGFPMKDCHAKDLIKQRRHAPMLEDLAKAIGGQRKVYPVSRGIVVDDFNSFSEVQRRFFTGATVDPGTGTLKSTGCPSKPYFVPFQNVVKIVTDAAPVGGKAHFSVGIDRPFYGYATTLYKQMLELAANATDRPWASWKSRNRLGTLQAPSAAETAPLQAADLLAHLTYLHMDEWVQKRTAESPDPPVPGLLLNYCLTNMREREDHQYQDAACLESILEQSREYAPNWDRPVTARPA
jgi:hypothetical protein